MEQGSIADLLTLAKSGDNGGMGGNNQWLWLILIFLFFGGNMMGGLGGKNAAGMNETSQLILEKLNQMSTSQCQGDAGMVQLMNSNTNNLGSQVQGVRDALANCCCETNLNICKLGHQIDTGNCQLTNTVNAATNAVTNLMTNFQFANQSEFSNVKNQMANDTSAVLAAIKASEANVIGWMTQEKISNLQGENLVLRNQLSQNDQTATITSYVRDLICHGCCSADGVNLMSKTK